MIIDYFVIKVRNIVERFLKQTEYGAEASA
jgi:hypothetical protein